MTKPYGLWHYEYDPSYAIEPWRVADTDGDYIERFQLEEQAKDFVKMHNEYVDPGFVKNWKY